MKRPQRLISRMRTPIRGLAALLTLALVGCAPFNHSGPESPAPRTSLQPFEPRPRVALVLSSGGPRGFAHIGVMRVLEEAGIEIDLVVGTSVGALLGAFWADGRSAAEIDALSRQGGPFTLFDFSPFADRGWIHGQRLQDYVDQGLVHRHIERMPRRLVVGATRRDDKVPVFFSNGRASVAVRASSAIRGVFSPVGIEGIEYEDGDESLPLAVRAAREAGARFVIAVDVSAHPRTIPITASASEREYVLGRAARIAPEAAAADFLIEADMRYYASPLGSYFEYARLAGERSARNRLARLLEDLERAGLPARGRAASDTARESTCAACEASMSSAGRR
jgi:NTE family protein